MDPRLTIYGPMGVPSPINNPGDKTLIKKKKKKPVPDD